MSQPLMGTIYMFAGTFAPRGYALCNGQLLGIAQNQALFAIIGTTYGGNGTSNFALPNLQGRSPVHAGNGAGLPPVTLGEMAGQASTTLTVNNLPAHTHPVAPPVSTATATVSSPVGAFPAIETFIVAKGAQGPPAGYAPGSWASSSTPNQTAGMYQTGTAGGSNPVTTQSPFLALNFIIATQGLFPTRN